MSANDDKVVVGTDGGKQIDSTLVTTGAGQVERQAVSLADPVTNVRVGLGPQPSATSLPVTALPSDVDSLPVQLTKIGEAIFNLGQQFKDLSLSVVLAADHPIIPVAITDGLDSIGTNARPIVVSGALSGAASAAVQAVWFANTPNATTVIIPCLNYATVELSYLTQGGLWNGATNELVFEAQDANTSQWVTVPGLLQGSTLGAGVIGTVSTGANPANPSIVSWVFDVSGYSNFRVRLNGALSAISGNPRLTLTLQASVLPVTVLLYTQLQGSSASGQPGVLVGGLDINTNFKAISFDASGNLNCAMPEGVDSLTGAVSANWNSGTPLNTVVQATTSAIPVAGATCVSVALQITAPAAGTLTFEFKGASGVSYAPAFGVNASTGVAQGSTLNLGSLSGTVVLLFPIDGAFGDFQVRLSQAIQGSGSVFVQINIQGMGHGHVHDNLFSVAGQPVQTGVGPSGAGVPRVTVASDSGLSSADGIQYDNRQIINSLRELVAQEYATQQILSNQSGGFIPQTEVLPFLGA